MTDGVAAAADCPAGNINVGILARVIPDSYRASVRDDKKRVYRLSLSLLPDPRQTALGPRIPLSCWPKAALECARRIAIHAREKIPDPSAPPTVCNDTSDVWPNPIDPEEVKRATAATHEWQRIFAPDGVTPEEGFQALATAIANSLSKETSRASLPAAAYVLPYSAASLASHLEDMRLGFATHEMLGRVGAINIPEVTMGRSTPRQFWRGIQRDWFNVRSVKPSDRLREAMRRFPLKRVDNAAAPPEVGSVRHAHHLLAAMTQRDSGGKVYSDLFRNAVQALVQSRGATNAQVFAQAFSQQRSQSERIRAGQTLTSAPASPPHEESVTANSAAQLPSGYFSQRVGDVDFWAGRWAVGTTESAPSIPAGSELLNELAAFEIAHAARSSGSPGNQQCQPDELADLAGRKLMGIQSLPSLAKYMTLIVDLELTENQLAGVLHRTADPNKTLIGFLAAELLGTDGDPCDSPELWTAYAWRARSLFLPATREQVGGAAAAAASGEPHAAGLLDLTVKMSDGKHRYQAINLDVPGAVVGTTQALSGLAAAALSGSSDSGDFDLPQLRSRGVALLDRAVGTKIATQLGSVAAQLDPAATGPIVLYSDDLVVGFRLDAARLDRAKGPDSPDTLFRSLMRRIVETGAFHRNESWVEPYLDRDDAVVRTPSQMQLNQSTPVPPEHPTVIPQETITTWAGESLAVRPRSPREKPLPLDPICDLAMNFKYDTPTVEHHHPGDGLPALRFGENYRFGARLVYLNGSSIPFTEAARRYDRGECVLGGDDGGPFGFKRYEPVGAPDVLVPDDDPIVQSSPDKRPGDQALQLVVRTTTQHILSNSQAHRYLVPPRSRFDFCELHGLFDDDDHPIPEGAFTYLQRMEDGSFKTLMDTVHTSKGDRQTVRATILRRGHSSVEHEEPYYPDPWARTCTFAFSRDSKQPAHYGAAKSVAFWGKSKQPSDSDPIRLTLKAAKHTDPATLGSLQVGKSNIGLRTIPEVSVELAPGEIVELWGWCTPDANALEAGHWIVARSIALARGKNAESSVRSLLLGTHPEASSAPIPEISQKRVVTLVHAVDRPLADPHFDRWDLQPTATIAFNAIALVDPSQTNWQAYTEAHQHEDPRAWVSEAGGATHIFVGRVNFHRLTTAELRCEARWLEFDEGDSLPRKKDGQYEFTPRDETKVLFRIAGITSESPTDGDTIDLLRGDSLDPQQPQQLRMLTWKFPNVRARRLSLRLIATSRFTAFFPPDSHRDDQGLGTFETHSAPMSQSQDIAWILNTARPDAPVVDFWSPPVYGFQESWNRDKSKYVAVSEPVAYRLWHPAGFYSSGEDTTLGVLCLPADTARVYASIAPKENEIMEKLLGPLEQYVTRWGTDPYVVSGGLEDNIGTARFAGYQAIERDILVPLGLDANGQPVEGRVDVVAYKPELDKVRGKWRFDVAIDPGDAYFPWVRLKLVRFQPHSIPGHYVSLPQEKWVRVPPKRRIEVEFTKERTLTLQVRGVAYLKAGGDPKMSDEQRALANAPSLWVLVQEAVRESDIPVRKGIQWKPCLDTNGQKMLYELRPEPFGHEVRWVMDVELPERREESRYGLHLQETQYMAADGSTDSEVVLEDAYKSLKFDLDLGLR